jgi:hypothetical protein
MSQKLLFLSQITPHAGKGEEGAVVKIGVGNDLPRPSKSYLLADYFTRSVI